MHKVEITHNEQTLVVDCHYYGGDNIEVETITWHKPLVLNRYREIDVTELLLPDLDLFYDAIMERINANTEIYNERMQDGFRDPDCE